MNHSYYRADHSFGLRSRPEVAFYVRVCTLAANVQEARHMSRPAATVAAKKIDPEFEYDRAFTVPVPGDNHPQVPQVQVRGKWRKCAPPAADA